MQNVTFHICVAVKTTFFGSAEGPLKGVGRLFKRLDLGGQSYWKFIKSNFISLMRLELNWKNYNGIQSINEL